MDNGRLSKKGASQLTRETLGLLWPPEGSTLLPLGPLIEPPELPVVPAAPPAPLPAPPPPPPPPPPPCANAPELSASAATNESAKILARVMLKTPSW
jgi:hypothetical protein